MAVFSVLVLTAPPPGQASEAGGAFVKVDGRECLLRSVELFLHRDNVKQIRLVVPADGLEESKRKFGGHLALTGVKLLTGGPKWIDQVVAGAANLVEGTTHVIVHDAARPATAFSDIDAIMSAAESHEIVTLTAPLRSSLVEIDEGDNALAYHTPDRFVQLLTPRVYSRKAFDEVAAAKAEPHASKVMLIKGSALNIRVGGSGDNGIAKMMISMLPKPKIKAPSSPFEEAQW